MDRMVFELSCVVAVVRSAESWSALSIVAGILLLGCVFAAMVAGAVRVVTRR